MATNNERATQEREGRTFTYGLAADAAINAGAMVMIVGGLATQGAAIVGAVSVGKAVASAHADDGDALVEAKLGCFGYANSSTDPVGDEHIGEDCFIVDDETVSATDGGGSLSRAGKVREVAGNTVWVHFD